MNKTALRHAWGHYQAASNAADRLAVARKFSEIERQWDSFLMHAAVVFNKINAGSKVSQKSAGWYSKYAGLRRADPMLNYLKHARNAAEHGIKDITDRQAQSITVTGDAVIHRATSDEFGNWTIHGISGTNPDRPVRVYEVPARVLLVPVHETGGRVVDVPDAHLGRKFGDPRPDVIAKLAAQFMRSMLDEAGKLPAV